MLSEIGKLIVKERYCTNDEKNWRDVSKRVASFISQNENEDREKYNKLFFDNIYNLKFLPASPVFFNAGIENKGSMSPCFGLVVQDNMESIMDISRLIAMILKYGGGVGINLSHLRPKDSPIKTTHGKAMGPVEVLKHYDSIGNMVTQAGKRKAAMLGLLDINHGDIKEFITAKDIEGSLSNFNISVKLTGKELNDKRYLPLIIDQIYKNGEPGLLFFDTINNNNFSDNEILDTVNPCITGDTLIAVADGRDAVPIYALAFLGQDVPVYCYHEDKVIIKMGRNPRMTGKKRAIYKITLDDGSFLKCTENHSLMLRNGMYKQVRSLNGDESLMPFNKYYGKYIDISMNKSGKYKREHIMIHDFYHNDETIYPKWNIHHKDNNFHNNRIDNLEKMTHSQHCSMNVSGDKNPMRRWWNNATEQEKEDYRQKMSFATSGEKNGRWKGGQENHNHKIKSIEFCGFENVYNLTVDDAHNYVVITDYKTIAKTRPKSTGIIVKNCGETPTVDRGNCCLGSINLVKFFKDDDNSFDWEEFENVIKIGIRFLDNVLDLNIYPDKTIKEKAMMYRQIGLGIMGLADLFILFGYRYGDENSLELTEKIFKFLSKTATYESVKLGKERGFCENTIGLKRRNATCLSVAPTGTLSRIADVSPGIEPNYAKKTKSIILDKTVTYNHPLKDRDEFVVATEIDPFRQIDIVSIAQKHVELSISKTINLPNDTTKDVIKQCIKYAYEKGLKGITFYRDGSRKKQQIVDSEKKIDERPFELSGKTYEIDTGLGKLYVTINGHGNKPVELFATIGKAGNDVNAFTEALGRLISLAFRNGVPAEKVSKQLRNISGNSQIITKRGKVLSVSDALGKVIDIYINESSQNSNDKNMNLCPECGNSLVFQENCENCPTCAYSRC